MPNNSSSSPPSQVNHLKVGNLRERLRDPLLFILFHSPDFPERWRHLIWTDQGIGIARKGSTAIGPCGAFSPFAVAPFPHQSRRPRHVPAWMDADAAEDDVTTAHVTPISLRPAMDLRGLNPEQPFLYRRVSKDKTKSGPSRTLRLC